MISHPSQGERNEGGFGQLISVGSTWRSPLGFSFRGRVVSAASAVFWMVKSGCMVGKIGKGGSSECSAPPGQLSTEQSGFFLHQHKSLLKSCLGCPLSFSEDLPQSSHRSLLTSRGLG